MDKKAKYINKIRYDWIIEEKLKNDLIKTLISINNPFYLGIYYNELDKYFEKKTKMIQKWLFDSHKNLDIISEDINKLIIKQFLDNEKTENNDEKLNIELDLINNFF